MRKCFNCNGDKIIELIYQEGGEPLDKDFLVSGYIEPCLTCDGTGEIEEGCLCHAYCSCECLCGAWDDHECDCWEG